MERCARELDPCGSVGHTMASLFVRHCQHQQSFVVHVTIHQDNGDDTRVMLHRSHELGPFDAYDDLVIVMRTALEELELELRRIV